MPIHQTARSVARPPLRYMGTCKRSPRRCNTPAQRAQQRPVQPLLSPTNVAQTIIMPRAGNQKIFPPVYASTCDIFARLRERCDNLLSSSKSGFSARAARETTAPALPGSSSPSLRFISGPPVSTDIRAATPRLRRATANIRLSAVYCTPFLQWPATDPHEQT